MADNVLRSRRATAVATIDSDAQALEVRMRHANTIATAKSALPQAYQNNPGAVLLAQEWAAQRGLDLLTTLQSVAFIGGKPVIDATMQRALAMRAGYTVVVTEVTTQQATVEIRRGDDLIGTSVYTWDDAKLAQLTTKDNWKKNPKAMLVARATAQGMRWYAPDVMVGVFTEEELDDPVEVLVPQVEDDIADAEIVDGDGAEPVDGPPVAVPCSEELWDEVKAFGASLDPIDQDALKAWVEEQGWTFTRKGLTEEQAGRVLAWRPPEIPGQQTLDGGEVK